MAMEISHGTGNIIIHAFRQKGKNHPFQSIMEKWKESFCKVGVSIIMVKRPKNMYARWRHDN